jgi:hypothetical protein
MIYLIHGLTASVWLSLRESMTASNVTQFDWRVINDISNRSLTFSATDLQPSNPWSRFELGLGTASGQLDLQKGMYSYSVSHQNNILDTGKILVESSVEFETINRPDRDTKILRR